MLFECVVGDLKKIIGVWFGRCMILSFRFFIGCCLVYCVVLVMMCLRYLCFV